MLFSITIWGQTIPNNEFNNWISGGSYEEPEFWSTLNKDLALILEETVYKSPDAYSGSFSAKLQTRFLLGITNVPGLITLAQINANVVTQDYTINGGLALNENVAKLTGMYKYDGVNGDSATVLIYNFKRDNQGDMDTIGYGVSYLHDASTWTPFTVNMGCQNSHIPDTFNVIIISSGSEFHDGSVLYVDSLTIETNTGIINLDNKVISLKTYPNPCTEVIAFETTDIDQGRTILLYDLLGNLIKIEDFSSTKANINIRDIKSGLYSYQIQNEGNIFRSGTFIKE